MSSSRRPLVRLLSVLVALSITTVWRLPGPKLPLDRPGAIEINGLVVRPTNEGIRADPTRQGLLMEGAEIAALEVVSRGPASTIDLVFDSRASARLEAEGATVEAVTLTPQRQVIFRLALEEPEVEGRRPWVRLYTYRFKLLLLDAPDEPLALTLLRNEGADS